MNKKTKVIILLLSIIAFGVIWFIPFTNANQNKEGEYQYCRYRFAVYEFYRIESEGEGYNPSDSDTYFGSIILQKKIGGLLEYFGLKKIKESTKE